VSSVFVLDSALLFGIRVLAASVGKVSYRERENPSITSKFSSLRYFQERLLVRSFVEREERPKNQRWFSLRDFVR